MFIRKCKSVIALLLLTALVCSSLQIPVFAALTDDYMLISSETESEESECSTEFNEFDEPIEEAAPELEPVMDSTDVLMGSARELESEYSTNAVITLSLDTSATVTITSGGRKEVRFTAPADGTYKFESSNRGSLDPTAYIAATGGSVIDDDSGESLNYKFQQTLTAGQTFTYYSGVYNNSTNANGSYTVTVVALTTTYTIIKNSPINGSFSGPSSGVTGSVIPITIQPHPGYSIGSVIVTRSDTGASVAVCGSGNSRTFTMPASSVTVRVSFTVSPSYSITKIAPTNGSFSVPTSGVSGRMITITIHPNPGYTVGSVIITRNDTGASIAVSGTGIGLYGTIIILRLCTINIMHDLQ